MDGWLYPTYPPLTKGRKQTPLLSGCSLLLAVLSFVNELLNIYNPGLPPRSCRGGISCRPGRRSVVVVAASHAAWSRDKYLDRETMSGSDEKKKSTWGKRSGSPYRQPLRLRHYDYRENGYYFVTFCTKNRTPQFATAAAKALVQQHLEQIPRFFSGVSIDQSVVMPDHLHVIFIFQSSEKPLSRVIQVFKSWMTRSWGLGHSIWQRNYYEHVIRNEAALKKIREYIVNNPVVEQIDCEQFYR